MHFIYQSSKPSRELSIYRSIFVSGTPDTRFIRVETCMFMIKLPQYSTQEIMTERLLYAINCREDPLSG